MAEIVNPWANLRISRGWTQGSHAKNPAIDYPVSKGTPIPSPADGVISLRRWGGSRVAGDPGNKIVVNLADGRSIHIAHLDSFTVAPGQRVKQGQIIGYSGNTGNVEPVPTRSNPGAGAHIHTFGITLSGARWNWTELLAPPRPADTGTTIDLEEIMKTDELFYVLHEGNLYLGKVMSGLVHVQPVDLDVWYGGTNDPNYWDLNDGKPLLEKAPPTFNTRNNADAFASAKRLCGG